MKKGFLFSLLICIASFCNAQDKTVVTTYYASYDEKPSASNTEMYVVYVYHKSASDSLWPREMFYNRKNRTIASRGYCRDSAGLIKQGNFVYYYDNGKKWAQGIFADNRKEGEWKEWGDNAELIAKENYRNGHKAGLTVRWYKGGTVKDSIVLDETGAGIGKEYFEDGKTSGEGLYKNGFKSGEWSYYYPAPSDKKCMLVQYRDGEAATFVCFDEKGEEQKKDCVYEREANYPGDAQGWQQYLANSLGRANAGKYLAAGKRYRVMVRFIVNKSGEVTGAYVEDPGAIDELNELALKFINKSRTWIPAVQYNRTVNAYRRQPITFAVD